MRRPLRIGLLGAFGVGNLGNDASLDAMIRMIHSVEPHAEVICFSPRPETIRANLGVRARPFRVGRSTRGLLGKLAAATARVGDVGLALRQVGQLDALVVPGTGILDDFGGVRPSGWPFTLALWFGAARLRGTRCALVGVGAGPLDHPTSRRLTRLTGRFADHISVRDHSSWRFLSDIGLGLPTTALVPDVAFALPTPVASDPVERRPVVAVPVMKYHGWHPAHRSESFGEQQTTAIGEFCCWLLEEGYAIRLITADAGDQPAADHVAQAVSARVPELAAAWLTSRVAETYFELTALLCDATAVVATRYHSVIGALACRKPTLSLGYAAKNDELMAAVGMGEYCQRVDQIDQELLRRQFAALIGQREQVERDLGQRVAAFSAELATEADRIRRLLRADPIDDASLGKE